MYDVTLNRMAKSSSKSLNDAISYSRHVEPSTDRIRNHSSCKRAAIPDLWFEKSVDKKNVCMTTLLPSMPTTASCLSSMLHRDFLQRLRDVHRRAHSKLSVSHHDNRLEKSHSMFREVLSNLIYNQVEKYILTCIKCEALIEVGSYSNKVLTYVARFWIERTL